MRANISFHADIDQVVQIMRSLVCGEAEGLEDVSNELLNESDSNILEAVTKAINSLDRSREQLEQYRHMIVNFEKAKLQTVVPEQTTAPEQAQTIPEIANFADVKRVIEDMESFDSFLSQLPEEDQVDLEVENDEPEEG